VYRLGVILLSVILAVLLLLTGILLFLFSDTGNHFLQPYVQQQLRKASGMPVTLERFTLRSDVLKATLRVDHSLHLSIASVYSLKTRRYQGVYHLRAADFAYGGIAVREADVKGHFRGNASMATVDGKGNALDAPLAFRATVLPHAVRSLEVTAKGVSVAEVLRLAKQPALVSGKADLFVHMPTLSGNKAVGTASLHMPKAHFDRSRIQALYGYTIPRNSYASLDAEATLRNGKIAFVAKSSGNLFHIRVDDGVYTLQNRQLHAAYKADVKEMRILSQNRLAGPFAVEGTLSVTDGILSATALSHTLGGTLRAALGKTLNVTLQDVSAARMLRLLKQPALLRGILNGNITAAKTMQEGTYTLALDHGLLNAAAVHKEFGYRLAGDVAFKLDSSGTIAHQKVYAKTHVISSLGTLTMKKTVYDMQHKSLSSPFDLHIPDPAKLTGHPSSKHSVPIALRGKVRYGNTLLLQAEATGLGKKTTLYYDGKALKATGGALAVGRLLRLAGQPVYVTGKSDISVRMDNLLLGNGSFSVQTGTLKTHPQAWKHLLGRPLDTTAKLSLKGLLKRYEVSADARLQLPASVLMLQTIRGNMLKKHLHAEYRFVSNRLEALAPVLGTTLHGVLKTSGTVQLVQSLSLKGTIPSLGGKIDYRLQQGQFQSTLASVPLTGMLKLLGYPQVLTGTVSGNTRYRIKSRKGTVDMTIASFRIKPGTLTQMLTPVIGKDPSRIIFTQTRLHADIHSDTVIYTLHAKGTHSSIVIDRAQINTKTKVQRVPFTFTYGKRTIKGKIKGTLDHPKITLDTKAMLQEKLEHKLEKKIEKKWGKKAGELLKGFGL
jgi:hypothetical protein